MRLFRFPVVGGLPQRDRKIPMSEPSRTTPRALLPLSRMARADLVYLLEPLPGPLPLAVPDDHPELDLFGIQRIRKENDEDDAREKDRGRTGATPWHEDGEGDSNGDGKDKRGRSTSHASAPGEGDPGTGQAAAAPAAETDPLPARMLNEFVYCPRLFYYEQVEGIFVHNADTERGASIHEKIDRGKGALPQPKKRPRRGATTPDAASPAEAGDASGAEPVTETGEADLSELKTHRPEAAKEPKEETIHSRSAMLSSERLGVVAKMDVIEVKVAAFSADDLFARQEAQRVTPVDYKAGAPRQGAEGNELWDADKMQLGLQILILRDNGYTCDEGVIYYRTTRQRVPLVMTGALERWIVGKIAEARVVAASPVIPPPLVNSPKCVRCSLAPVCLPDETRLLRATAAPEDEPERGGPVLNRHGRVVSPPAAPVAPRRLIAARDDERALYLNTQGYRVGLKSERLVVKDGDAVKDEVRLHDVSHVSLFGNIQISTQAVQELCDQEIPVAYFSQGGWFYGLTRGHGLKNVHTRIQQFAAASNPLRCLEVAQKIVQGKIRNHRTMLMRLHTDAPGMAVQGLKDAARRVADARGLDELLGMEGAAAALYFQHFPGLIKVGGDDMEDEIPGLDAEADAHAARSRQAAAAFTFDFTRRSRRPPTDPVNALLSLAYSLLTKDCTLAAIAAGLDPYVGFYHQPRHGRPALALDLMEEFRPLVAESAVLTAINNRMITPSHFVRAGDAVNLSPTGRKAFFHAYEQRMNTVINHPVFDYKVSYRRVLELQARLLARWLTGEIPDYIPMATR